MLLGINRDQLLRHPAAQLVVVGTATLVIAGILALIGGVWSLGGSLVVALAQVAVTIPLVLIAYALYVHHSTFGAVAATIGIVLGGAASVSRWRTPMAGGLAALCAAMVLVINAATGDLLAGAPILLILVLVTAAATAAVGSAAVALGARGVLPVAAGPLAAALAGGGIETSQVLALHQTAPSSLGSLQHLPANAVLWLVLAAAVGGLGAAHLFATRRIEIDEA
ncbi:MAG TPA: hypothetical protein VGJ28_00935 [Micromonosporaceae bacterium]